MKSFIERLNEVNSLADIFELVKDAVRKIYNIGRAGLSRGLAELGLERGYFIGAFHPVGSNIIIMNKTPFRMIEKINPELIKPYAFHILLHEYIHTLGNLDEDSTRRMTYQIVSIIFGPDHPATLMSKDLSRFFPNLNLIHLPTGWQPPKDMQIEMVPDFDKSNINYIA